MFVVVLVVALGTALGSTATGDTPNCSGYPDTRAGQIARGACVARKLLPANKVWSPALRDNVRRACEAEIPCMIGVCHVARNVCKGALDTMCNHVGAESPADGPAFRNAACRAPRADCGTAPNAQERAICLEVLPALKDLLRVAPPPPPVQVLCTTNPQMCNDQRFCNGVERCQPGAPGADARGCLPAANPACFLGQVCNEDFDRCTNACPDVDRDGHFDASCPGGDDCDDRDPNRYPGNPEVCDAQGHDEDCNPCTIASATSGDGDVDGDGFVARTCSNTYTGIAACDPRRAYVDVAAKKVMGVDCDDTKVAVVPGAMVCAPGGVLVCPGAGADGTRNSAGWLAQPCPPGSRCIAQPNATGVCR